MVKTLEEVIKSLRETSKMEKWEYKIDLMANMSVDEDVTSWLNFLGQEGWELITCNVKRNVGGLMDMKGIFKRKIQQG